jgi:hypothetical protein
MAYIERRFVVTTQNGTHVIASAVDATNSPGNADNGPTAIDITWAINTNLIAVGDTLRIRFEPK